MFEICQINGGCMIRLGFHMMNSKGRALSKKLFCWFSCGDNLLQIGGCQEEENDRFIGG